MPTRADTYALARSVPYLIVRGATDTLAAPVRHGATGALVAPTGGTVTITRPEGTDAVSAQPVTVTGSQATYDLTTASTETLGAGWTVKWSLTIDGQTYPMRESAYLVEWFPQNVVSVLDLYTELPELKYHVPQDQHATRGDGTGWQPQIDQAFYDFVRRLLDDGRPVWKVREHSTGVREWILSKALVRCIGAIPRKDGTTWQEEAKTAFFRHKRADTNLRLQYDDERATLRRGARPVITLAPTGRSRWY